MITKHNLHIKRYIYGRVNIYIQKTIKTSYQIQMYRNIQSPHVQNIF